MLLKVLKAIRLITALLLTVSTAAVITHHRAWMQEASTQPELGRADSAPLTADLPGVPAEPLVTAPADAPTSAAEIGAAVAEGQSDFVVHLAPPDPSEIEIPAGIGYEEARAFAEGLASQRAARVVDELLRLRAEGLIADFDVRLEVFALFVRGAAPGVAEALASVPGVVQVVPGLDPSAVPCSPITLQALAEQVYDIGQVAGFANSSALGTASTQSSPPTIHARLSSGGSSPWSYFYGYAVPNTLVTMRIVRRGNTVATGSTTSDASTGYYSFYPSWVSSGCGSYSWSIETGDLIEVTAGNQTASMVVPPLQAWVDPNTDTVAGQTLPGRQVEVTLFLPNSSVSQTVSAGSSGAFNVGFSVDFDRQASARIAVFDGNGNSAHRYIRAYHVQVSRHESGSFSVRGALKPNVNYTLIITRGSSTWLTATRQTDADNAFSFSPSSSLLLQPNDVVFVAGGGLAMQYTVVNLSDLSTNVFAGTVSGKTAAGRAVRVCSYARTYSLVTACPPVYYYCANATADAAGAFTAAPPNLSRGNRLEVFILDSAGNQQAHYLSVGAIVAAPENQRLGGYWLRSSAFSPSAQVTLTVRRPDTSTTTQSQSLWGNEFSFWGITIPVGSVITVTDGLLTETMQVQTLTARVNESNGQLFGTAANGRLIADASDGWTSGCAEANVNGSYSLAISGMPLKGQSSIGVWLRGPDGHYTARHNLYAFTVNAFMGISRVTGYTERLGAVVTVTLQRSSATLATITTTSSSSNGFYSVSLGSGIAITTGDKVIVQSNDGDGATVDVPTLTAIRDGVNNRVHGQAPAGSTLGISLRRWYGTSTWSYYTYNARVTASSANTYTASFAGRFDSWNNVCSEINVGHRCSQVIVQQYNPAGHATILEGPMPPPVGPDAFENDDSVTSAKPYTGVMQIRSFHVPTDTDWVTFTVPAANVGIPYIIATFNEGWGGAACIELRDNWGWLASDCQIGLGSRVQYVFNSPGTYRLRVYPSSSSYAGHCDASYRLLILPARHRAFVPALMR